MIYKQSELGRIGEDLAVEMLLKDGYKIIERNYRIIEQKLDQFGKGEIDIIALDPVTQYTVFIEVKTRSNLEKGDPVLGVTRAKMKQLRKVALAYIYAKNLQELLCRFDIIAILMSDEKKPVITHYINAFTD